MHENEKKLIKDISNITGFNIYSFAIYVYKSAGFSNEFVVKSNTKDETVSFGKSNLLHWTVLNGWIVDPHTGDFEFEQKLKEALVTKQLTLIQEANA